MAWLRNDASDDYYEGFFQGKKYRFPRMFRGYRFSDEECRALFAGNRVEVHNIHGRKGIYAVQGCLKGEHLDLISGQYDNAYFYVIDLVPNKRSFSFGMPLYNLDGVDKPIEKSVDLTDDDLEGISFEDIPDLPKKKTSSAPSIPSFRETLFSCFVESGHSGIQKKSETVSEVDESNKDTAGYDVSEKNLVVEKDVSVDKREVSSADNTVKSEEEPVMGSVVFDDERESSALLPDFQEEQAFLQDVSEVPQEIPSFFDSVEVSDGNVEDLLSVFEGNSGEGDIFDPNLPDEEYPAETEDPLLGEDDTADL